jgi:hypothetical protein
VSERLGYLAPPFLLIQEPTVPRISQEQTQERHAFLLDLFHSNPDISRQEAMEAFEEKFGSTINVKTFNQLREQAQKEHGGRTSAAEPVEADEAPMAAERTAELLVESLKNSQASEQGAGSFGNGLSNGVSTQPAQKAKPAKGARQRNVFIDAPKEQLDFLERTLVQLQEAGATNVRIDHATERWMVLTVDAK